MIVHPSRHVVKPGAALDREHVRCPSRSCTTETSTGVLSPLADVAGRSGGRPDVLLLVAVGALSRDVHPQDAHLTRG